MRACSPTMVATLCLAMAGLACEGETGSSGGPADAGADAATGRADAGARDAGPRDGSASSDGSTADAGPAIVELPGGRARLTFADELDGTELDRWSWNRWYTSPAVINEELQFYHPDSFELGGGLLRIVAERRASHGFDYTSGALTTFGAFSQAYGWFEMRAKVPAGNGLWPAFWLLPADLRWPPEIDVLEHLGEDPSTGYFTYHWRDSAGAHQADGESMTGVDLTEGFHTYAVDWRPEVLVWYVDGVERHRVEGPQVTSLPAYVLLNMAVGGTWPVDPDDATPFPARYEIDYVRVYQYETSPPGEVIPIQYGKTTASAYVLAPGEAVDFDVRVQVNEAPERPLIVQAILYDESLSTSVVTMQHTTPAPPPVGTLEHRFSTTLPADLAPGLHRLSVGLFHEDWSGIAWLSNAVVLEVR